MPEKAELSEFLRSRRVPGLRREEIARLAGVSTDYYVRLEQGRSITASDDVLDALARALQLDAAERTHLHHLAKPRPLRRPALRPQRVRPGVRLLLDGLSTPAFVLGRRLDVLATNRMARALLADFDAMTSSSAGTAPSASTTRSWATWRSATRRARSPMRTRRCSSTRSSPA